MKIQGAFELPAGREDVYRCITDPGLMAQCVPGCEEIERLTDTSYKARVAIGVGNINARFNLVVQVTREEPPALVLSQTRGEEGSRSSMISADNSVALIELADGTRVEYTSEVSVTGRLGKFALGVMKKKVESLGQEFAARLRTRIESSIDRGATAAIAPPGEAKDEREPAQAGDG